MSCNNQSQGTRLFSINPGYQCIGGPFFWGNKDSETYKYCSNPANWPNISQLTCCTPGFVGKPYQFRYSTESDGQWKNTRCSCLACIPKEQPGLTYTDRNPCTLTNKNLYSSPYNGTAKMRILPLEDVGVL